MVLLVLVGNFDFQGISRCISESGDLKSCFYLNGALNLLTFGSTYMAMKVHMGRTRIVIQPAKPATPYSLVRNRFRGATNDQTLCGISLYGIVSSSGCNPRRDRTTLMRPELRPIFIVSPTLSFGEYPPPISSQFGKCQCQPVLPFTMDNSHGCFSRW